MKSTLENKHSGESTALSVESFRAETCFRTHNTSTKFSRRQKRADDRPTDVDENVEQSESESIPKILDRIVWR